MNLIRTDIEGVIKLKPKIIKDERGYFIELYNQDKISKLLGNVNFVQENESFSSYGVLRGLHFQKPPHTQAKLVKCVKGCVLDIAVDLRKKSKTYGQFIQTILSDDNKEQLFIPKGFAHGFIVLSDYAVFSYKVDNYYHSNSESGIIWNDSDLQIDWRVDIDKIVVSEKDKNLSTISKIINPF